MGDIKEQRNTQTDSQKSILKLIVKYVREFSRVLIRKIQTEIYYYFPQIYYDVTHHMRATIHIPSALFPNLEIEFSSHNLQSYRIFSLEDYISRFPDIVSEFS